MGNFLNTLLIQSFDIERIINTVVLFTIIIPSHEHLYGKFHTKTECDIMNKVL